MHSTLSGVKSLLIKVFTRSRKQACYGKLGRTELFARILTLFTAVTVPTTKIPHRNKSPKHTINSEDKSFLLPFFYHCCLGPEGH